MLDTATLFVQGNWTQLQQLQLDLATNAPPEVIRFRPEAVSILCQVNWLALKTLDLSNNVLHFSCISMLVSKQWPLLSTLNLSNARIDAKASLKLLTGHWPVLQDLDLSWNKLDAGFFQEMVKGFKLLQLELLDLSHTSFSEASAAHLIHLQAQLKSLCLSYNNINAHLMSTLIQAGWKHIQSVDLSQSRQDTKTIQKLTEAGWSQLDTLCLGGNAALHDAAAVQALSHGQWPLLATLDLQGIKLDAEAMSQLIKGGWPCLKTLCLSSCQLEALSCSVLQLGKWPLLDTLKLEHNPVGTEGMMYLAKAAWPNLSYLDLSDCGLDFGAMPYLVNGKWPLLCLRLQNNLMVTGSMAAFSTGHWPMLRELAISVKGNEQAALCAVICLSSGNWPLLQKLTLNLDSVSNNVLQHLLRNCQPLWDCLQFTDDPCLPNLDFAGHMRDGRRDTADFHIDCPDVRAKNFPHLRLLHLQVFYRSHDVSATVRLTEVGHFPEACVTAMRVTAAGLALLKQAAGHMQAG